MSDHATIFDSFLNFINFIFSDKNILSIKLVDGRDVPTCYVVYMYVLPSIFPYQTQFWAWNIYRKSELTKGINFELCHFINNATHLLTPRNSNKNVNFS